MRIFVKIILSVVLVLAAAAAVVGFLSLYSKSSDEALKPHHYANAVEEDESFSSRGGSIFSMSSSEGSISSFPST